MQESIQLVIESLPYFCLKAPLLTLQLSIMVCFWSAADVGADADVPLWPVRWLRRAFISRFFAGTPLIARCL